MDASDYQFKGYHDDDAKLIHDILEREWDEDILKDKVILYFNEADDITSFNYNTGEASIKIYGDEAETKPMGIGFDSINQDRKIHINVRTMDRDLYLGILDEIRRIMIKYRLRPGNCWDTLWVSEYKPNYPSDKFFDGSLTVNLKMYCHTLPISRKGWTSDTYY